MYTYALCVVLGAVLGYAFRGGISREKQKVGAYVIALALKGEYRAAALYKDAKSKI